MTILIVALFVVFVARGLSAAVSRPVGLLEAGASGVATSVCIFIAKIFAMASNSVTFLLFVNKFTVSADHHVSASEVILVNASLHVVEAFAAVRSFFVTRDRAAGAVHDDSLLAFLDDADAKETVGAAVREAVVAF